ncbi:class I SAM-dependent methyltransferase [Usitatibacter palustris]|uniref:Putative fatty acid methyltransferase n=1 Tax=Usitatibacter palustris TaxID=2732487 RepID=A0A6M4H6P8_9PROT|nr:class I SAM-dependent methyltransferase [Usitatibacter palustris]QJR15200.1 putative fatty acid methyltransferase [Usitatibacter palustris]
MFLAAGVGQVLERLGGQGGLPLRVVLWDGREFPLSDEPLATVRVKRPQALTALSHPTLLSLAEAYVNGDLDLEGDLDAAIRAAESLARDEGGPLFVRDGAAPRSHTREEDSAAIRHHYDVANGFYALWLDPRMVYSCAYFRTESDSLEQAQLNKLDHICRKLRLDADEQFLDIGCGWGALILHAAKKYGARATGITLSEQQFEWTQRRIREEGLQHRCRVLLEDYRDHQSPAPYDKIASVGMFEHVGIANLPTYFATVRRLLRERGLFMNHGITSSSSDGVAVGMGAGEFIDRYVFPQGEIPHLHRVVRDMSDQDFEVHDVECLRPHYAKTLRHWSANFERRLSQAVMASSEKTARVWRLYLAGCAHAFDQRWTSIHQILASRQVNPGRTELPLTREWIYR